MSEKWFLLEFTQRPMIVINSHCLVVMGVNTLTMENRYSVEMGWWVPRIGCWETPYSNSGSKNGCASGPRLVHPHRRKEESSGDFLAKFPAQEKTKNAERPFLRPTSRPETGNLDFHVKKFVCLQKAWGQSDSISLCKTKMPKTWPNDVLLWMTK